MAIAQQGLNEQLEGGRELNYISQRDAYAGSLFSRIVEAVNTLAKNAGVAAVGKVSPPHPIDSIQVQGTQVGNLVTCPGEILHHTITHNQAVQKGVRYFSEVDTNPSFTQPHVIDHGASRSSFLTLPTYQNDNHTLNTYYLRSYAQYPGSDPCKPTVFGGTGGALQIQMTGSNIATLLPSTGSGTASPQGQQGGKGLGVVLDRPSPRPKRSV
jgi:hypothetical protein